jgi:hypothetical protein
MIITYLNLDSILINSVGAKKKKNQQLNFHNKPNLKAPKRKLKITIHYLIYLD